MRGRLQAHQLPGVFARILSDAARAGSEVLLDRTNDCLVVRGPNRERLAERLDIAMVAARAEKVVVIVNAEDYPPVLHFLTRAEYDAARDDLRGVRGSVGFVYLDGTVDRYDPETDTPVSVDDVCGQGFLPTHDEYGNG